MIQAGDGMPAATSQNVIAEMLKMRSLGMKLREIGRKYGLTANGVHSRLNREARREKEAAKKRASNPVAVDQVEVAPGWFKCVSPDCERWIRKGGGRMCRDCFENIVRRSNRPTEDKPSEAIREMLRRGFQVKKGGA